VPGEQEPHVGQHLEMGGNGGLADVDGRHDVAPTRIGTTRRAGSEAIWILVASARA
jgi:hypothetical protein